jgi:antitoxin component of RelBE/YafQ-DinJ toxin-antitoxin module
MKTSELIALLQKQLKQNGDLPVFLNTGNDDDMWAAQVTEYHATEKGEFPKSWNMPETFLKICA